MWCFDVTVGAVQYDSTVCVVSFNIAGPLKSKVGAALPASATPPPKRQLTNRESSDVLAADSVVDGILWRTAGISARYAGELVVPEPPDFAVRRHLPF